MLQKSTIYEKKCHFEVPIVKPAAAFSWFVYKNQRTDTQMVRNTTYQKIRIAGKYSYKNEWLEQV